jgi:hypothetical protein
VDQLLDTPEDKPQKRQEEKKAALEFLQPITSRIREEYNTKNKKSHKACKERDKEQQEKEPDDDDDDDDDDEGEPDTKRQKLEGQASQDEKGPKESPKKRQKLQGEELQKKMDLNKSLFSWAFPNVEQVKPKEKFKSYVRTDGVACSIIYERKVAKPVKSDQSVLCPTEGRDLESPKPPIMPQSKQRLIGIDPGRRDMIVAVEHNSGAVLKMSTRQHVYEAGRSKAKAITMNTLRYEVLSSGESLKKTLSRTPPSKEIESSRWSCYLRFILPLLDVRAKAYRRRAIRRVRFENYMKRDKSLDILCNRLCSLGRGPRKLPALIAFGDGSHCSTGFGHPPAPLGRFRKRLEQIHNARVTLIQEAYTSQKCSRCHSQLEAPKCHQAPIKRRTTRHAPCTLIAQGDGKIAGELSRTSPKEIHGVRVCRNCKGKDCHPLFLHRDVNAAKNMNCIYLSLAENRTRPSCFMHSK